jgi:uncharacterized protein YceH (UPF0502 family)
MPERRVLGVLIEKAKTTPDAYPMSLNGLTAGCNQKSNRDPLLNLSEDEVEETLLGLNKQGLVSKIIGGRVERWRHMLYEGWRADKVELAVLAELLLRGPQTEGELRGRASRMEPIDDLDALRGILHKLVERRLVVYLTPEGRRGTILSHGFHSAEELAGLRSEHPAEAAAPYSASLSKETIPAADHAQTGVEEVRKELADLRAQVADLQGELAQVTAELQSLKQSLGT